MQSMLPHLQNNNTSGTTKILDSMYYYCLLQALMSCSMHALQIQRQSICHHLKFIISKAFLFSISQNRTIHLVIIYYLSVPYRPFMFILWQSIKIDKNISYKQILKVVYRVGQVCCIGMWIVEPIPICTVRNTICIIKIQLKKICLNRLCLVIILIGQYKLFFLFLLVCCKEIQEHFQQTQIQGLLRAKSINYLLHIRFFSLTFLKYLLLHTNFVIVVLNIFKKKTKSKEYK